jgi:RimJ/RimL family protein N-acetyltransferase
MMNYWEGERIRLRSLEPDDAQTFHSWNSDSEMARNIDFLWPPSSLAGVKGWLEEQIKKGVRNDEIQCVIETKPGDFVGTISSHHCDRRVGCFKYGLAVQAEQRRKGYATEAICMFVRYFFEELRYQKVAADVFSFNNASIQLHERLGFQLEGRLRRMLYTNGRYHDKLVYGMTKEEFKERYG